MKEYTLGENTILVVKVPEDSSDFRVNNDRHGNYLDFETILHEDDSGTYDLIDLPPGNWTLLGKASSITEQQAKGLVEYKSIDKYGQLYYSYEYRDWMNISPLESFHSWLTVNGIDKDSVILKKE